MPTVEKVDKAYHVTHSIGSSVYTFKIPAVVGDSAATDLAHAVGRVMDKAYRDAWASATRDTQHRIQEALGLTD